MKQILKDIAAAVSLEEQTSQAKGPLELLADLETAVTLAEVPQEALEAYRALNELHKRLEEGLKASRDVLVERFTRKTLKTANGTLVLTFKPGEQRRPAWEEIATNQARAVAAARGQSFDEKQFVATIKATTKPTPTMTMKVVEHP